MNSEQLEKRLSIIFDKVLSDQENGLKDNSSLQLSAYLSFNYPNTDMMIDFFAILQDREKTSFIDILKKRVQHSEEIKWRLQAGRAGFSLKGISPLCFLCLVKIGQVGGALDALSKRGYGRIGIYSVIYKLLEENYFDSQQLDVIFEIVKKDYFQHSHEVNSEYKIASILQEKLIQVRHEFLKRQIRNINTEINQDKETVTERIHLFGFSPKYQELLDCIDAFLLAETPKPLNAGMINNLRTFMGDLVTDLAQSIAEKEHKEIPCVKQSKLGNMRYYLKNKLDLTDKDDKLIDSFIDVLHSEGGHSFLAEQEYFRLSRNIAIEISLFILSKYGKKYGQNN